jgi:hypothetical protein
MLYTPAAQFLNVLGFICLPLVLGYGLIWGFMVRQRWPGFSAAIRRGFWIMAIFGAMVSAPVSLPVSLLMVDLLLFTLGALFHSRSYAPAIREYGRFQCWAALICLTDYALLSSAGLMNHPHLLGCAAARTVLVAVCMQLFLVGVGVWLSIMLPLITEMRKATRRAAAA